MDVRLTVAGKIAISHIIAEDEEDVNEDAQLVILSVGEDSEGEYLDVVEDDETLMEVSKLFEQRLSDQFEIE